MMLGFFVFGLLAGLLSMLFSLAWLVFWIWMLVDCIKSPGLKDVEKIVWVLVIIFVPVIGVLLYFLVGRKS